MRSSGRLRGRTWTPCSPATATWTITDNYLEDFGESGIRLSIQGEAASTVSGNRVFDFSGGTGTFLGTRVNYGPATSPSSATPCAATGPASAWTTSEVLAWPEFRVAGEWVQVGELFGTLSELEAAGGSGFSNAGGETLFDAVARTAVDWDGLTCSPGTPSACDLSATVLTDLGRFPSRDDLFAGHGQTLCGPLTTLADPFLSRWAPPAVTGR